MPSRMATPIRLDSWEFASSTEITGRHESRHGPPGRSSSGVADASVTVFPTPADLAVMPGSPSSSASSPGADGSWYERLVGDAGLPARDSLPWYVAPLPRAVENLGLNLAWLVVAVNLVGTAFGFWYYRFQFAATPAVAWPVVPDSPVATLFIALSLAAWRLGRDFDVHPGGWVGAVHALAFFGCIKLGGWTPFVQLFLNGPEGIAAWLYWFLILSHLAMVAEAFLIHRYFDFPVWAVAVAAAWYGFNDVVDYFVPVVGGPHHTYLRAESVAGALDHSLAAHDLAAAAAVVLTLLATFLALATRVKTLEGDATEAPGQAR